MNERESNQEYVRIRYLHTDRARTRARNAQINGAVAEMRERRRLRVGADRGHVGRDKEIQVIVDGHPTVTLRARNSESERESSDRVRVQDVMRECVRNREHQRHRTIPTQSTSMNCRMR